MYFQPDAKRTSWFLYLLQTQSESNGNEAKYSEAIIENQARH